MNCKQAASLLVSYLNDEVSSHQKTSLQAHLADCPHCRQELQIMSGLETRLTRHLHLQAEEAHASAHAWKTLRSRLDEEGRIPVWDGLRTLTSRIRLGGAVNRRFALALVIILLLLATPPVRTLAGQIGEWASTWFRFLTPGTGSSMSVGGFEAFVPYAPQYLPVGFDSSSLGGTTAPNLDRLELTYTRDGQFVTLLQSKKLGLDQLPAGENLYFEGHNAVFVREFAASSEELQEKVPGISISTNFDYGQTSLLAWYAGEIKIELVSNLPEEEMMKIALSLEPAVNAGQ